MSISSVSRLRIGAAAAAAGAVALSVLVVSPAPAKAPAFAKLTAPSEVPIAGVAFNLDGVTSAKVKNRPVNLQAQKRGSWKTLSTAKTRSNGSVTFTKVTLPKTTTVRLKAPKWSKPGERYVYKVAQSKPLTITVNPGQSGTLSILPGVVGQGSAPAAPTDATQAVATFSPARIGRTVTLQRLQGKTWTTIARGKQDGSGSVGFTLPDKNGTYRATTAALKSVPAVATAQARARNFNLIFEDTFDAAALDAGRWSDETKIDGDAYQRSCARIDASARTVAGGTLNMGVAKDLTKDGVCNWVTTGASGTNDYMVNTQVTTRDKFAFTYGYAAARMKLQADKGMHSSFWLQPQPGSTAASAEIDVMEFFGRNDKGDSNLAAFVHEYKDGKPFRKFGGAFSHPNDMKPAGDTWWDSYHVFSVEWTPQGYVFRVDGREFHRETNAVSHSPQYLLLSMLTSDYELPNLTPDRVNQTAAVDWVRVWQ